MKNLSLALNILLLLAVAYLYLEKFSGNSQKPEQPQKKESSATSQAQPYIVYVNIDSLLENYDLFKKQQEDLQKREQSADASLKARGRALEKEMMAYSEKMQTGTLSRKEVEDAQEMFGRKQQALMADQEAIAQELLKDGAKINENLQKALKEKLQQLQLENGYTFVMSYGTGSPLLAAADSLEITSQVLGLLNAQASADNKDAAKETKK